MSSLNQVVMSGRLTKDPAVATARNGNEYTTVRIACSREWNDKNGGGKQEETCFINAKAWDKTGKNLAKFFKKGSPIILQGRLRLAEWKDEDGKNNSFHEITVENFFFMETKKDAESTVEVGSTDSSGFDAV